MSAFDAYVQAAFHGGTMSGGPTFTVVHDAETPLRAGYADSIAEFFRRGPTAGTSAHAMVDPVKAIKMLPDNVVAWAAGPKANTRGWHLEQAGYASFTRAQWTTTDGLAQIRRAAACLREVHDTWGIPKRWVTDDQLRRAALGDRSSGGMTTHQQVTRALGGTTHTDPEERYPRDLLLQAVSGGSPISPTPALQEDTGMAVIKSPGRPAAVIGPGYYRQLNDEEAGNSGPFGQVINGNDRQYDLWVSMALTGQRTGASDGELMRVNQFVWEASPPSRGGPWPIDRLKGIDDKTAAPVDVDEVALAAALAPKLNGVSQDEIAAALRQVLREGTDPASPAA